MEVRKALLKQIVAAVDAEFLEELWDEMTNDISKSVAEVLTYLFENFGRVGSADVQREEEKVKAYFWNVSDPPMAFYTLIEDLQKVAKAAGLPQTEEMLINHGLDIIKKTTDFEAGLLEWYRKNDADKTWANFKRHFSSVHRDLKEARGQTMRTTTFHQAHHMADEINASIADLKNEFRQSIATLQNTHPPTNSHTFQTSPLSTLSPSANAATTEDLLQLVIQLQNQIINTSKQAATNPPKNSKRTFIRNNTNKYCWSHGACGHDGKDCRNKKPGHRDEATFADRLGGSTMFCKQAESNQQNN